MSHGQKDPEYTDNKCPICGGRHDTPAAEAIITLALNNIVLGDKTANWFKATAEGLYDGHYELKLISRIYDRIKKYETEPGGVKVNA